MIIGEPTGERINLTGEVMGVQLPNSRLNAIIPTANYAAACGDSKKIGVQPDVLISLKEKDVTTGTDPAMQYLFTLLKTTASK